MLFDVSQRTTLTLDDDVVARLKSEARQTGKSFKEVVNGALRAGLDRENRPQTFVVEPHDLGLRSGMEVDDISGLVERIEGERHR